PHPPYKYLFVADFRADYYAAGEENETAKAMNPRVFIEQNAVSGKIFNVRENARFVPLREKWLVNHVRISPEKRRFPSEKWAF
ncbi:MAG: hypothetical protein ABSF70_14970, partial [Terracidiphilus sp.]